MAVVDNLSSRLPFSASKELEGPPKKLASRVRRFFATKKDRLADVVPRFIVIDGIERQGRGSVLGTTRVYDVQSSVVTRAIHAKGKYVNVSKIRFSHTSTM